MKRRLLLWDIDGTLIRGGDAGATAFDQAVGDVLGRVPPCRPQMGGRTDPEILQEYLDALGVPGSPEIAAAILELLAEHLAARSDELARTATVCPGVPELLARLAADCRLVNGVLTGNIAPNARVKLAAFGLDRWVDFDAGAYGSDHGDRNALVPIAMGRVAEHHQLHLAPEDVWVIGDTPQDLACARAAGAHCLLVATGRFSAAELEALDPEVLLEDLTDVDAVLELLTAKL